MSTASSPPPNERRFAVSDLYPLLGFVVPTVIIGYGFVIPRSCIAGVNELTVGFATSILAASITYIVGVQRALKR